MSIFHMKTISDAGKNFQMTEIYDWKSKLRIFDREVDQMFYLTQKL